MTSAYALGVSPRHPEFQTQLTRALTMFPRNIIDGPYYVVHEKELNEGARSPYTGEPDFDMWTPRSVQVGEKTNACTACHRLGNTKRGMPHNVFFTDNNLQIERRDALTDAMKEFPYSNDHVSLIKHFPLPEGKKNLKDVKSEADWKSSPFYTKGLRELVDVCYATPEACKGKRVDGN